MKKRTELRVRATRRVDRTRVRAVRRAAHLCAVWGAVMLGAIACNEPADGAPGTGKSADLRPPAIGAMAPAFSARSLDDRPVSLDSLRGKVVLLNVWATWCVPCLAEMPQLEALQLQYADKGVTLIGVSIDAAGMGGDVRDFARDHRLTYAIWLDPERSVSLAFLTNGVPETFLIDRAGVIRWRKAGALTPGDSSLTQALDKAISS